MKEFDNLSLDMKDKINSLNTNDTSAYAFLTNWLWKTEMGLKVILEEDAYLLKTKNNTFLMPQGSVDGVKRLLNTYLNNSNATITHVTEKDAKMLENLYPNEWIITRAENKDEYVCDKNGHIQMEGSDYADARRLVRKVEREHKVYTKLLDKSTMSDARIIIKEWQKSKNEVVGCCNVCEKMDISALNIMDELGLEGIVLYVDDKPFSLVAGYYLSKDTFDMAIAKSADAITGVSYYAKREMMKSLNNECKYVNLEDDVGLAGLRKMKKSLVPVKMNYMYTATRK